MHRSCHPRGGGGLGGGVLEVHVVLVEDLAGVAQHVHQVRDGGTLVAADIGDPRLEKCLGDGQDALSVEGGARALAQVQHLVGKGSFGHAFLLVESQPATTAVHGKLPSGPARGQSDLRRVAIQLARGGVLGPVQPPGSAREAAAVELLSVTPDRPIRYASRPTLAQVAPRL